MKTFDPEHPRCLFPKYGGAVDSAMRARGLSATDVAKHLHIHPSCQSEWRRGFGRSAPTRTAKLEALLGVKLDMSEALPSARGGQGQVVTDAPLTDPVLPHLAAIALAHGFKATFTPL